MISFFQNLSKAGKKLKELNITGLTYPNNPGYYITNQLAHPHAFIGNQYYPLAWTVDDKTFLAWNQRDGDPYNNESMVLVYDHTTKKISDSYAWGEINPPNSDIHLIGCIIGTADNKLLMLEENPHIGPIYSKTSGAGYDITTNTGNGFFSDGLAYPHIIKFSNGDLYCIFRASTAATGGLNEESGNKTFKSIDNGETWTDLGMFVFFPWDGTTNEWAYPLTPYNKDDKLRCFVNRRRGVTPVSFPYLYYVESADGVTWTNKSGSFSKDISVNGYITPAELETHCLVLKYGTGAVGDGIIKAHSAAIDENGNPCCVCGHNDSKHSLRFVYWDGSAWVNKPLSVSGYDIYGVFEGEDTTDPNKTVPYNNTTVIVPKGQGTYDVYCTVNIGGYAQLCQFSTTDRGTTWTYMRQLTEGSFNHWNPEKSANFDAAKRGIIACVRMSADNTYSDLFIREL